MPPSLPTPSLRQWLGADIHAALDLPVVFDLRLPIAIGTGYVAVHALGVEQNFGQGAAVTQVYQMSRFRISIVRPWPDSSTTIQDQKEADVAALLPILQPDARYHDVGHFPVAAQISYEDGEDEQERISRVSIEWTTVTFSDHH